jgi:hypothetical protein
MSIQTLILIFYCVPVVLSFINTHIIFYLYSTDYELKSFFEQKANQSLDVNRIKTSFLKGSFIPIVNIFISFSLLWTTPLLIINLTEKD